MTELPLNHSLLDPWLAPRTGAGRWCVAFSGGPDSTVLLHLIHCWCEAHSDVAPPLIAVHVNHGMQASADDWQAHCEVFCGSLDIPIIVSRVEVENLGQGSESAARKARYGVFEAEIGEQDVLFMGHHLDDQVETFFLRLLRGAGLSGLSAMPARRGLGGGELVRPLIKTERRVLQAYASDQALRSIDDPSNTDTSIDRNYLREEVLPLLAARWDGYRHTIVRAADHAATSQVLLDECLPAPETVFSVMGDPGVEQGELLQGQGPVATESEIEGAMIKLRKWLRSGGLPMPPLMLLQEFLRQLCEGTAGSSPRLECSSYILQRYQDRVYLLPDFTADPGEGQPVAFNFAEINDVPGVGEVSIVAARAEGILLGEDDKLELRWRRGGERCRPSGRPYNQRLKKLLQELAVPPWWRDRIPLLYLHDELLAVGDLWLCESSRLRPRKEVPDGLWQLRWQRKPCAFD